MLAVGGVLLAMFLVLPQLSITEPMLLHDALPITKLINDRFKLRRIQAQAGPE